MVYSWPIAFIQLLIFGCTGNGYQHHHMMFESVSANNVDDIVQMSSTLSLMNNSQWEPVEMGAKILITSGDVKGDTFGALFSSSEGKGIERIYTFDDTSTLGKQAEYLSNNIDFSSLIYKNDKIYSVSHAEDVPGGTFFLTISQNTANGELTVDNIEKMDWTALKGVWSPCAGSVSPWNTHLGAEEYEPDAADITKLTEFDTEYVEEDWDEYSGSVLQYAMRYWNVYPDVPAHNKSFGFTEYKKYADTVFFPYAYGYTFEVVINDNGGYSMSKHYSMGRRSGELAVVLPDKKTTYVTDDGTNVYLSVYVADKESDLTAGTLHCAKFTQTSSANNGEFTIEWLDMGHATDEQIQAQIETIKFEDMFERKQPLNDSYPIICPENFTAVQGMAKSGGDPECLRLVGDRVLASRLESRRYAAYIGCTTEFRKMEGATYSEDSGKLYMAIAEVGRGMEDRGKKGSPNDKYDLGSGNQIKLPYNRCGCIYELTLDDKSHLATNMKATVCGSKTANSTLDPFNKCDVNGIQAPDNVASMQGYNALLIAEDGSNHVNNAFWKYNLEEKTLERLATVPTYSEIASPYFYPDINGFSYLTFSSRNEEYDNEKNGTLRYFVWKSLDHDDHDDHDHDYDQSSDGPTKAAEESSLSSSIRLLPFTIVSILCFYAFSYSM